MTVITRQAPFGTAIAKCLSVIQVTLRLVCPPEGIKEIVQTLRSLMLRVQAAAGFRSGRLMQDIERPNELCYIEEWDGNKELDQQIRSRHYTRLLALMETAAEPPEMRLCWVTDIRGLEYLAMVRLADGGTNFTCPNDAE